MPELTLDDVTLHYDQSGEGPDIVWLAAGDHPGSNWRRWQVPAFEPGWRNTTYDARGVGETGSRTPSPWPIEVHAARSRAADRGPLRAAGRTRRALDGLADRGAARPRPTRPGSLRRGDGHLRAQDGVHPRVGGGRDQAAARAAARCRPTSRRPTTRCCTTRPRCSATTSAGRELRSFIASDFEARDGAMLAAQWQACLDFDSSELLPATQRADPRDRVLGGRADAAAAGAPGRRARGGRPLPPAAGPRARLGLRPPPRRGQRHCCARSSRATLPARVRRAADATSSSVGVSASSRRV